MTNMIRCSRCSGQGKIQGMGWVESECPLCSGKCKIAKPVSSFDTTMVGSGDVSCGTSDSTDVGNVEDVKQVIASKSSGRASGSKQFGKRA